MSKKLVYNFNLGGLLFVLFVGLKLTGQISWSWWWVTAPLWAPFVVIALVILGIAILKIVLDRC